MTDNKRGCLDPTEKIMGIIAGIIAILGFLGITRYTDLLDSVLEHAAPSTVTAIQPTTIARATITPVLPTVGIVRSPSPTFTPTPIVITSATAQRLVELARFDFSDLEVLAGLAGNSFEVAWKPDGQEFIVLPWGHKDIFFFSVQTLAEIRQISLNYEGVDVEFSPDGRTIAVSNWYIPKSGEVYLLNAQNGSLMVTLDAKNDQPDLAFSPDRKILATGGYGKAFTMWRVDNGSLITSWDLGEAEGAIGIDFSPNGRVIATRNRNGQTKLWDAESGKLLHALDKQYVHDAKFNPTGTVVAVAYVDGTVRLWDVTNGQLLTNLQGRADEVYSVAWSPNGEVLAFCGKDGPITLWSVVDKTVLRTLEAPLANDLTFSPDGRFLLSGGRVVRIWGIPD